METTPILNNSNPSSQENSVNWWQLTRQLQCINCKSDIWTDKKKFHPSCIECGEEQFVARPCCVETTSCKRFSVNINEQHVSCSDCNSDMIRLPCCRQFQPSLQLDNNIYDCVTCSKYSVACTSNCINCLPPKGFSWKCQNFNCAQFTVHCNYGRLTYQDLKTKYKCPCGYEFEYDIEAGVEAYKLFLFLFCCLYYVVCNS